MPRCACGFDFARARLEGRKLTSYTLIPHKNYRATIRREYKILGEKWEGQKLKLIAGASASVGSLTQCPDCGAWLLDEPMQGRQSEYVVLRRIRRAANKKAPRMGTASFAQNQNRKSFAAGSRR